MGYAAEKQKVNTLRKRIVCIVALVVFVILLTLCIISAFVPTATWKYYFRKPKISNRADGDLRVHFIDVGQGDCTLVELPDGKIMLVDGGDGSGKTENAIMRYLNALKIDTIDYLVVTHADVDHCGALDTVLKHKEVVKVFLPTSAAEVNAEYAKFYKQLNKTGCAVQYSSRKIDLGITESKTPYALRFLCPYSQDVSGEISDINDHNAQSAVLWLDYHGASVLLTGDAPHEVEEKLMRDEELGVLSALGVQLSDTEILKVAHHGSDSATSEEFLYTLQVKTAVISCGEDNQYGHPSVAVNNALTSVGADVYRTDMQGSIIATLHADGTYEMQALE